MNVSCLWTEENLEELAQHGVTVEEYEAAIANALVHTTSRSSDRPAVIGDAFGRILFCVYIWIDESMILPWTAYDYEV